MGHLIVPPVLLGEGEGLPTLLADTAVNLLRGHRRAGLPEVAEAVALAVDLRHPRPKSPAGLLAVSGFGDRRWSFGTTKPAGVGAQAAAPD